MEYFGGDVIGEIEKPLEAYYDIKLPEFPVDIAVMDDIKLLRSEDTFLRFQAIGRIVNAGPEVLGNLAISISNSTHRQFNRDVMECVHYFLVEGLVDDKTDTLISFLKVPDKEVRTIMADNFGIWAISEAEEALIEAAVIDECNQVRRFALKSLMTIKSTEGLAVARKLAIDDRSPDVRRVALKYLSEVRDYWDPYPIMAQAYNYDSDPTVRVATVEAIAELADERGLDLLHEASKSYDAYLMRAAGEGLCNLYQIEGVEVLIESLSFPSIDAFYNYDRNVPNAISAYAGFDFPEEDRYNQAKWREWFDENKAAIDIQTNADAYREFKEIHNQQYELPKEELIRYLDEFLLEFPDHSRVQKFLARLLNQVAWNMVTAVPDTPEYNPEMGLKYALRAVELVEDINYIDTLAEAYFANGQIGKAKDICLEMLEKHPGNRMFLDRLKRCEEAEGQ
jgi:hypothetical protein